VALSRSQELDRTVKDALLREKKDQWLAPFAAAYLGRVSPNLISLAAMVVGVLAAMAVFWQAPTWGLGLWLLNRLLDGLDGAVARVHHKSSDLGGYLDLMGDFVVYLAVPIAFVAANPSPPAWWALAILLCSYQMNSLSWALLAAILAARRHRSRGLTTVEMPPGLIEGAETAVFYTLFFLWPQALVPLFGVFAALVFLTAGQRVLWAWHHLREDRT